MLQLESDPVSAISEQSATSSITVIDATTVKADLWKRRRQPG